MENREFDTVRLENLLEKEIGVLKNLYASQKRMYEAVLIRDWILLQKELMVSGKISETFQNIESQRNELLRNAFPGCEGSIDFYRITSTLPETERSRINGLFREVRKLLLLSKTENDVFNTYVSNARTVVEGMIDSVMPERRNKIYTRRGSLVPSKVESLMVNRSF